MAPRPILKLIMARVALALIMALTAAIILPGRDARAAEPTVPFSGSWELDPGRYTKEHIDQAKFFITFTRDFIFTGTADGEVKHPTRYHMFNGNWYFCYGDDRPDDKLKSGFPQCKVLILSGSKLQIADLDPAKDMLYLIKIE
jgi:hypothetical protein